MMSEDPGLRRFNIICCLVFAALIGISIYHGATGQTVIPSSTQAICTK